MKALVLTSKEEGVTFQSEYAQPAAGPGEVLVRVMAAALNHRDVWITRGQYAGIKYPTILGSDGAGEVVAVGEGADATLLGQRVVINPNLAWGDNERFQGRQYTILGLPRDGTFAEYVAVGADRVHPVPVHLDIEQAAALPLAGLTAYRALFGRANLQPGERVLISGVGGGVALYALQFALAVGAEVFVTSGSADKIARAVAMGARAGADYRVEGWQKAFVKTHGEVDVVIDSAGGTGFAALIDVLAPGGRLAFYGGGQGNISGLNPQKMFWKQVSVLGSTMGSDREFVAMLDLVNRHQLVPVVDSVHALADGRSAFDLMARGGQFGKIVLRVA